MKTDRFFFYSKSADKNPGSGKNEYVKNVNDYDELAKIKDWRKCLSNFYVSPFILDGEEWNSLEHWYHAVKFRNNKEPGPDYNYYKTFTTTGGKSWSLGGGDDAWYAGQAGKPRKSGKIDRKSKVGEKLRKAMTLGFFAKFTQNPKLKKILLETKDAELWHVINRSPNPEFWDHLMRVRDCIKKYDKMYDLNKISQMPEEMISKIL